MPTTSGKALTIEQVAERLSVTKNTVRQWIARGELPAYRVGPRFIRVNEADLDAMIRPITPTRGA